MLDFLLSLLLLALLVVKDRINFELNIPQFFFFFLDGFQCSSFSGVLLHEHFQFRLPLFRGQLFAGKAGVIQLALHGVKLPDLAVMLGLVLFLLSEAALGWNSVNDGFQSGIVLRQTDQVFQFFHLSGFCLGGIIHAKHLVTHSEYKLM